MQDHSITAPPDNAAPSFGSPVPKRVVPPRSNSLQSRLPDGVDPSWPPPSTPNSPSPDNSRPQILEDAPDTTGFNSVDPNSSRQSRPHPQATLSVFDQPPIEVGLTEQPKPAPQAPAVAISGLWGVPVSTPELRQVAGLTAGMALPLDLPSYTFSDRDAETGFAISVVGQQVLVTPGATESRINGDPVTTGTVLGSSVLDVETARFLIVQHHEQREPNDWLVEESRFRQPEPILEIPAGLTLEHEDTADGAEPKDKRSWRQAFSRKNRGNNRPIDLVTRGFVEQVRQSRARAEARERHLFPDPAELQARVRLNAPTLRSQGLDDPYFAQVGVLWADKPWTPRFNNPSLIPARVSAELEPLMSLRSVPITADPTLGPLGIVGPRNAALACVRNFMVGLFALSNDQLSLHVAAPRSRVSDWNWAAPIARSAQGLPETGFPVVVLDGLDMFDQIGLDHQQIIEHRVGLVVISETLQDLPRYSSHVLQVDTESPALMSNHLGHLIQGTPVGITEDLASCIIRDLLTH